VCSYCIASCGDLGPAHGATFFIYYVRVVAAKGLQLQDKTYCNNPLAKSFFHCVFSKFISSQINLKKREVYRFILARTN
jgi:hypothetical protein